jgi:hypothetical protein
MGVTIEAESYTDQVLQSLIRHSGVMGTTFGQLLLSQCEDSFYQNWKNRHFWLSKGFDVQISGSSEGQDFSTLVELRNAIIHGAGCLTDKQSRDINKQIALERRFEVVLRVQVEGRKLRYLGGTDNLAVNVARRFVLLLDSEVRRIHPDVPI